jgi:hypothetical protein
MKNNNAKTRTRPRERRQHKTSGQAARARRLTPVKIGIGLGVVLLGGTALVTVLDTGHPAGALIAAPAASAPAEPAAAALAPSAAPAIAGGLPPPLPGTKVPINDVDLFSGKVVTSKSPTLNYKGYIIGFCCDKSPGWRGGWERMSESEKDAFVRKYIGY